MSWANLQKLSGQRCLSWEIETLKNQLFTENISTKNNKMKKRPTFITNKFILRIIKFKDKIWITSQFIANFVCYSENILMKLDLQIINQAASRRFYIKMNSFSYWKLQKIFILVIVFFYPQIKKAAALSNTWWFSTFLYQG